MKCDLCKDLREKGLEPACYVMCPASAIVYGEAGKVVESIRSRKAERLVRARLEGIVT